LIVRAVFDTGAAHLAANIHPPSVIYMPLAGIALACSLFAGFAMADGRARLAAYRRLCGDH